MSEKAIGIVAAAGTAAYTTGYNWTKPFYETVDGVYYVYCSILCMMK